MKKTIYNIKTLAVLLMTAAAFTACSSSDDSVLDGSPIETTPQTYTMTVVASKGEGAQTKALSFSGTTLNATWAVGEEVIVYNVTKSADLTGTLTARTSGNSTTLSGTLTGDIAAGNELLLKFRSNNYTSQTGTLEYIAANCDYATATVTVASVSGGVITTTGTAAFENQQAIIKFTLKDADGNALASNPSAFTITDATSTVSLSSIPDATYTTNGAGVLYVAFPATGSSKTINLTATVGSDTYTYSKSSVTFTNGQYYAITVKMTMVVPLNEMTISFDGGGSATIYYENGETWKKAITNHSENTNNRWYHDEMYVTCYNRTTFSNNILYYSSGTAVRQDDEISESLGYILKED